jgi:hypothetical protein
VSDSASEVAMNVITAVSATALVPKPWRSAARLEHFQFEEPFEVTRQRA